METVAGSEGTRPAGRFERWLLERVHSRRGVTSLPHSLTRGDIFVMPTAFGGWFALLLALMLLGGLNFNNNLTLLLGFLLTSIALVSALLAFRNLHGVCVHGVLASPVFCGESATFRILLRNDGQRSRSSVTVLNDEGRDSSDLSPQSTVRLEVAQQTWQRGWMSLEPFRLETRYPLGLVRAWSAVAPRARCLVYPEPTPHPPPLPRTGRGEYGAVRPGEGEHFHGLREYKPGDPIRRIAWRASARHGMLYSRQMESPSEEACELNWYLLGGGDNEKKLSILAAWILRAERMQIPYSLEMPGAALPADLGQEHRDACLEILALFNP